MICKKCQEDGKESFVLLGTSVSTAAYFQSFYDNNGAFHGHDGNVLKTEYTCTNGHTWSEVHRNSCWCGWPDAGITPPNLGEVKVGNVRLGSPVGVELLEINQTQPINNISSFTVTNEIT